MNPDIDTATPPGLAAVACSDPPACSEQTPSSAEAPTIVLSLVMDRLHAAIGGAAPVPVRLLRARPVTDPGGMLAIMDDRKRCLAELPELDALPRAQRAIAERELSRRYCIAVIARVVSTRVDYGNRYWKVETDRGPRSFMIRDPGRSIRHGAGDQVRLKDVHGNHYLIPSLAALDPVSRAAATQAL